MFKKKTKTTTFFNSKNDINKVTINGQTFTGNGPISIVDGQVFMGGDLQSNGDFTKDKEIKIQVLSGVERIESEQSIHIQGNVTGNINANGSVNSGDVNGNVDSGGSVSCDDIKGSVRAGGSVNCDDVGGDVNAGGSVNCNNIKGKMSNGFW